MKLFAKSTGLLALKPERVEACRAAGVTILGLLERMPEGGILIADTRPRKFVGGRGPDDPAATMLYVGGVFKPEKTFYFESFQRALNKALKLAA
ncbi:hypothetical protein [Pseudomonas azotoformans]|uniref:hypothetical protein n=1 Tax=Pseudomonas azotoformans TaxID=47878 RepID=UPI0009901AAB|nr:hypothetical protein [Pseudomonas azotoformans]AQT94253.1 hypothetical protein B1R45_13570 [Pseudomonas azotoformans]UMY52031.1 hypothetical protein MLC69_13520 [Pseudomonas azotoformans]